MLALSVVTLVLLGIVFSGSMFAALGARDEEQLFGAINALVLAVAIVTISIYMGS